MTSALVKGFGWRLVVTIRARSEGRRPKASQEGTRGVPGRRLPSMGIWRCGGLGRGCVRWRSRCRSDDRDSELVAAAAVDGVIFA